MKKIIFLLAFTFIGHFSYSQSYKYVFSIDGIELPGDAKHAIVELRDLFGVRVIHFHDDVDRFEIQTTLDFDITEMKIQMESIGFFVEELIEKTELE